MTRVGFIIRPDTPRSVELLTGLVPWLIARGDTAVLSCENPAEVPGAVRVPRDELGAAIDLAVVLGGDGTILAASALVADAGVPILGINLGRLGFLAPFEPERAHEALEAALEGRLEKSARLRLSVTHHTKDGESVTRHGLNDVVIHQGAMARLIELEARMDGELISAYRADGLIIATPAGSTAYNLAAGGPVIVPGHQAMVITPICPHTLTSRPLVVPADVELSINLDGNAEDVVLSVDGQWARPFGHGDRVSIVAALRPLWVYDSDKHYFDIMREKLHWGSLSDHDGDD